MNTRLITMKHRRHKVVLVVEDDTALNHALVTSLEREGYEVLAAKDGKEGFELAISRHPDLILLDLLMPILDGHEMIGNLRDDSWGSTANVIILTNFSMSESKVTKTVLESRPLYFFVKSEMKLKELMSYVNAVLA